MSGARVFKKGETLQKEGEKAQFIYLIQSGSVSLHMTRQKSTIELSTIGSNQIVGEHALSGIMVHPHSATALTEVKTLEFSHEALKLQIDQGTPISKLLAKAFADKLKTVMAELKSTRLEKDNTPCPAEQCAKVFGTLFHVAKAKGELLQNGTVKVSFPLMKQYAQRVFLESPKRLENALNIFVKLGASTVEMVKSDEASDSPLEVGTVHFSDLAWIEQFFEYYQYYFYKSGKQDLLKVDERVMLLVQTLLEIGADKSTDRHGIVSIDYASTVERFKLLNDYALNSDQFAQLENKGLFVRRQSNETGIMLQFEYAEFQRTLKIWKVLREVDKWNEKGFVDAKEPVVTLRKSKSDHQKCPACQQSISGNPKFCGECGEKLSIASAA